MVSAPEVAAPLQDGEPALPTAREVAKKIFSQSGPSVIASLFGFAPELVNSIFIGQYGNKSELAAVGLANMMQNVFGLSIGIGLCGGLDALASQARGSGELKLACIYAQRARLILSIQLVWMWPLLACCDVWLTALGQDPTVARLAAEYNSTAAPFLLIFFQNLCFRRLLSAFLKPQYSMMITGITTVFHVGWVELFVGRLQLGNRGLGLANGVTWTTRLVLFMCVWWKLAPALGVRRHWVLCFQSESLRGWGGFLKLGLPALVQTSSEWWFFEICALVVGYLGETPLAAHVATAQFVSLPFMVPIGIGTGASMLAGNAIGSGSARMARRIAGVSIGIMVVAWAVVAVLIGVFLHIIAAALAKDAGVQSIIRFLLAIYVVQGFADSTQNCMSSILRGLGQTRIPSITYLVMFYLVMLPLAIVLAFPMHIGVKGVWFATGAGTTLAAVIFARVLYKMDYEALVRDARKRIEDDGNSIQG